MAKVLVREWQRGNNQRMTVKQNDTGTSKGTGTSTGRTGRPKPNASN